MIRRILFISFVILATACGDPAQTDTKTVSATTTLEKPATETLVEKRFDKEVSYKNIRFMISSPGKSPENSFTVTPSGYTANNSPVTENIVGKVSDVLVDDMDGDDSPELAVIIHSANNAFMKVFMYSSNGNKSMSGVNVSVIGREGEELPGYNGHDEFNFVEGSFIRRFPLFVNDSATGKMRQFQYRLQRGEASKELVLYRTIEF